MTQTVTFQNSEAAETVLRLMTVQNFAEVERRRARIAYDKPLESEGLIEALAITNPVMATLAILAGVEAATDGWITKQWKRVFGRFR